MGRIVSSVARSRALGAALAAALAGSAPAAPPRYFGFTWLHTRSAPAAPYAFANIDVRPVYVSDPVGQAGDESRTLYEAYGVVSVLGFNDFLYGEGNTTATPRPNAAALFDAWWQGGGGRDRIRLPWVVALWPADEALLRCNGAPDMSACLQAYYDFVGHVRDAVAGSGVVIVDSFDPVTVGSGVLAQQAAELLNAGIRWFGYHQYDVLHPLTDAAYEANVARVRGVVDWFRARGYAAEFFLVGDGFHDAGHVKLVNGVAVPWDWSDHRTVVDEDFQVACRHDAVALVFFNWPDYDTPAEGSVLGSASFQDPAACWEECLGRVVKFGEVTCDLCGGISIPAGCGPPRSLRRHLPRR